MYRNHNAILDKIVRHKYNMLKLGLVWFGFMVFKVIFNNISVISWRSALLVDETGGHGENHRPVANR